jgi:hypothetical protein
VSYCHCGAKFSYDNAKKIPAPAEWQARNAWLCLACNKISHAVQEAVAVVRGPQDARALLHANTKADGQHILTWAVGDQNSKDRQQVQTVEFFPWPRRHPLSETEPLIHLTWQLLMTKVGVILAEPAGSDWTREEQAAQTEAKNQARGIAEVLAIQMKPFMESADQVVKCAVKAYKDPEFEVPGLGAHLWDPQRNSDGTPRVAIGGPVKKAAPTKSKVFKTGKTLTDQEREGIKEALSSGLFTESDIATMFKVSLAQVKEAAS